MSDLTTDEKTFENVLKCLEYLQGDGWRIKKSAVYGHVKLGMLRRRDDGLFHEQDVRRYAKTFLKPSNGSRSDDRLSHRKMEAESRKIEAEAKIREVSLEKLLGNLVPRSQWEIELAARAGILDAGLKHWVQSRAADLIRAVDGNMKKIGDLINMMNKQLDSLLNSYAAAREYEVIFGSDEEDEQTSGYENWEQDADE